MGELGGTVTSSTTLTLRLGLGGLAMKDVLYWSFAVPATAIAALILMRLMNAA